MGSTAKLHAVPTLAQLAQLFPKRTVLVVGDLVADHYIYGQTDRVSREAPVLIVRYERAELGRTGDRLGCSGRGPYGARASAAVQRGWHQADCLELEEARDGDQDA